MAAYIARFVLNCPQSIFDTAARNLKHWADAMSLPANSTEVILLRNAMRNKNHGALFYMITTNLGNC
jgi:hypothetical protein